MRAAAYRTFKQSPALLRREIFARGKPTLEPVLLPADEIENYHSHILNRIVAYIVQKSGNSSRRVGKMP